MTLVFKIGHATSGDILAHLRECDKSFHPVLSSRVDLVNYSEKIFRQAVTFEAWHGSNLVGLVASYFNDLQTRVGFITSVSTVPEWKGRGSARTLMVMALGYADSHGFQAVNLEVGEENLSALGLYHRLGFEEQGHTNGMLILTWVNAGNTAQMRRS